MKIALKNFEKNIHDIGILGRGKDYFKDGLVKNLKEEAEGFFEAAIFGTQEYDVSVKLDVANNIVKSYCDCPYDWGPMCKHEIAVFYALREFFAKTGRLVIETKKVSDNNQNREKAPNNASIKASFREIIKEGINDANHRGYIEWNRAWEALSGAEEVLEKINSFLKERNFQHATLALSVSIEVLVVGLQDVDDSAGEYGGFIVELIEETLGDLIIKASKYGTKKDKDFVVKEFLNLAKNKKIDGFDFEELILEKLLTLIDTKNYQKFQSVVDILESRNNYHNFSVIKYKILCVIGDGEKVKAFVEKKISDYTFSDFYTTDLISEEKYDKAQEILLSFLEKQNFYQQKFVLEKLLDIAEKTGDTTGQKKYLFGLFLEKATLEAFNTYKNFLGNTIFMQEKEEIFTKIAECKKVYNSSCYPEICLQEKEEKRFIEFFERNPYVYTVERYFTKLLRLIPEKLYAIYHREVSDALITVGGRKVYREQCRRLRKMKKIDEEKTQNFIKEMREKYNKRRALLEELDMV